MSHFATKIAYSGKRHRWRRCRCSDSKGLAVHYLAYLAWFVHIYWEKTQKQGNQKKGEIMKRMVTDRGRMWVGQYKGMDITGVPKNYLKWVEKVTTSEADRRILAPYLGSSMSSDQLSLF